MCLIRASLCDLTMRKVEQMQKSSWMFSKIILTYVTEKRMMFEVRGPNFKLLDEKGPDLILSDNYGKLFYELMI